MHIWKIIHDVLSDKSILVGLIICFIAYFAFVSFARHDNFYSLRLDLGNMDQTVWNVIHGNGFTLTDPVGTRQESRLAIHADFMLILLAPLYLIWSNPKMLLLVQAIFLGLGAIPIYWISVRKLKSKPIALLFALAYLLYPPRERTMLYDFHTVALAGPLLLFTFWYMEEKRWIMFSVFALLAAICKEQIWLVTAFMGVYITVVQRQRFVGTAVFIVSAIIFYLLFWKYIPAVAVGGQHFAFIYLSEFGSDQNGILKHIFTQPAVVLSTLFHLDRLYYLFQLFFPVGFLSFVSPWFLLFAAPSFAINLLSNNPLMRQIDFQYNSVIAPFIFIAAIEGFAIVWRKFVKKNKEAARYMAAWFVFCMILSSYLWGELPVGRDTRFGSFIKPQKNIPLMQSVTHQISSSYTVSATNNVGAHVSERKVLYNFPVGAQTADYVVVKLDDPYAWPSRAEQQKMVETLLHDRHYTIMVRDGDFYVFRKKN
jgi:uncharacterized membrane protein